VPNILQGVVQGVSVTSGMEAVRHGSQAANFALATTVGGSSLAWGAARAGAASYSDARAQGSLMAGVALKGMASGVGAAGGAVAAAARDQAMDARGTFGTSTLGLANAKLDEARKQAAGSKGAQR